MIKIKNLNKYFNKGKQNEIHVINGVNLELPPSGMVAIFGKSGCGKTTLLNVIGGLDRFASGEIEIDGNSIQSNTDVVRNEYIGYIFQNYNLNKTESCFDNVADALRLCGMTDEDEIERRTTLALANVDMDNYAKRPPDTLSGGQQQRIAIARAIVKNPRIILADEPTGNLDEANTVMIMDLLKQIAKDHLVILVTHEANLVDYYCDMVIELHDGKVANVRANDKANGYVAKNKNHIYLGELEISHTSGKEVEIEYYGEQPDTPIKIKIVNSGGKTYLAVDTPGITVLDDGCETQLKEGVYKKPDEGGEVENKRFDMSGLPPVRGKNHGKLFSFLSSVKSGYATNFKQKSKKKGKKTLKRVLSLFAIALVMMTTVLGGAFEDLINANRGYSHNTFYVFTPNGEVSQKIIGAIGDGSSGIDYARIHFGHNLGDEELYFDIGSFETFSQTSLEGLSANGTKLPHDLVKNYKTVAGDTSSLDQNSVVITTAMADKLIEKSSVGYIKEYRDLIGLRLSTGYYYGTVAGESVVTAVVESDESSLFVDEMTIAHSILSDLGVFVMADSKSDIVEVEKGTAVFYVSRYDEADGAVHPHVGEEIFIHGIKLKVSEIVYDCFSYLEWLEMNKIDINTDETAFMENIVKKEHPDAVMGTAEYDALMQEAINLHHFEFLDYFYSQYPEYLKITTLFEYDVLPWLYVEKGIEDILYFCDEEYYIAAKYKQLTGSYPKYDTIGEIADSVLNMYEVMKQYQIQYENEFYRGDNDTLYNSTYFLDREDYIAVSKQLGETHQSASVQTEIYYEGLIDTMIGNDNAAYFLNFTMIHSSDPAKTKAWIESEFSKLDTGIENVSSVITPEMVFDDLLTESKVEIISSLVSLAVILAIMSVCMYFIMRSTLMIRIKEIGIYRAIGVSKKNLIFKFAIESTVLAGLTVFVGYILASGFIGICHYLSPLAKDVLYYPPWLALSLLVVMYSLCLICGTLPIMTLLRKTPSEILAKYDI